MKKTKKYFFQTHFFDCQKKKMKKKKIKEKILKKKNKIKTTNKFNMKTTTTIVEYMCRFNRF